MYRERFAFATRNGTTTIGEPQLPAGHVKFDQTFNKNVETYRNELDDPHPGETGPGAVRPGCHVARLRRCRHLLSADGARVSRKRRGFAAGRQCATASTQQSAGAGAPWYERATNADYAQSLLQSGGFFAIIGLYFVAGVVLSLLPCSYPMIPILSAIIIGEGARVTRARGFALSLAYVFGMALVYTALGIAAALVGQSLGAWLQNPWVLGTFGVLLTVFALTLIAGFDIALPQRWQNGVSRASTGAFRRQVCRGGRHGRAVRISGRRLHDRAALCRAGVHRAHRQRVARRCGAVLDGFGLGVPLLIIGLGAGTLLPRAGAWMDGVKVFFGVVLLAAALWIVWPVLGAAATMLLSALWLLIAAAGARAFLGSGRRRVECGAGSAVVSARRWQSGRRYCWSAWLRAPPIRCVRWLS